MAHWLKIAVIDWKGSPSTPICLDSPGCSIENSASQSLANRDNWSHYDQGLALALKLFCLWNSNLESPLPCEMFWKHPTAEKMPPSMVVTLIRVYAYCLFTHLTPQKNVNSQETGRGPVPEKKGGEAPAARVRCRGLRQQGTEAAQDQPRAAHWARNPGLLCDLGCILVWGPGAPPAGTRVLSQRKCRAKQ